MVATLLMKSSGVNAKPITTSPGYCSRWNCTMRAKTQTPTSEASAVARLVAIQPPGMNSVITNSCSGLAGRRDGK